MARILITGIAGFIGFHMARALVRRGDLVIGIDNFNSYYTPRLKRERAHRLEAEGIKVIELDLNNQKELFALTESFQPTHLLHLAAQAGVRYSQKAPEAYLKSNIDGFLSILELLRRFTNVPLVYASSSSVYGLNEKRPFSEKDVVDRPANLYAATKKANELMAYSYHHLYGIPMTGLRFFTVYGPWGRPDMAYFSFSDAIMKKEPITLFNQGKMERDFTYIDDIISGTIAALDLGADWEIFNLGNHTPVPLLTFVSLLEEALGKKAELIFAPPSAGEVESTFADISHAQKQLNFYPTTTLKTGLHHFAEWYLPYYNDLIPILSKKSDLG